MTGDQLKALREARNLTREQLATELGDCSSSTINKWERNINPVPAWVEEKMLSKVSVNLPLSVLSDLMDFSRESNESFELFLSNAVRDYLKKHRAKPTPEPAKVIPIYEQGRPKKDKLKVASPRTSYESAAEEHAKDDGHEGQH